MTGGTEVVVTADLSDIGFIPQWAVVTGGGRWTLYEDVDFGGNSTCVGGRSFHFDYFSVWKVSQVRVLLTQEIKASITKKTKRALYFFKTKRMWRKRSGFCGLMIAKNL